MKFPSKLNVDAFCGILIIIFSCCNFVSGEDVRFQYCDAATSKDCRIVKVTQKPCREASKNEPCKIHKGEHASTTFSFIPHFSINNITIQAYGQLVLLYVPDPVQDRNGCKFTKCPIVAGQQHTLVYPYMLSRSNFYLPGTYSVKWKLWNTHKPSEECCFIYKMTVYE